MSNSLPSVTNRMNHIINKSICHAQVRRTYVLCVTAKKEEGAFFYIEIMRGFYSCEFSHFVLLACYCTTL